MELHSLLHKLKIAAVISLSPTSNNFYVALAMFVFAIAFLVVSVVRLVEWKGIGFSNGKRYFFSFLQVVGSICAALGFAVFAIDPMGTQKSLMMGLIGVGFIILFPIQIYLALVRRVLASRNDQN